MRQTILKFMAAFSNLSKSTIFTTGQTEIVEVLDS